MTRASRSPGRIAATVTAQLVAIAGLALGVAPASADPPFCSQQTFDFEVGETDLAASCLDFDSGVELTITQAPSKGTAGVFGQSVLYTASATGPDTFKYGWDDGTSSGEETVTTNNTPEVNDRPKCTDHAEHRFEVGDPPSQGAKGDKVNRNCERVRR